MTLRPPSPKHTTSLQEDGSGEGLDPLLKHTMVGILYRNTPWWGSFTAPPLEAEPPTS